MLSLLQCQPWTSQVPQSCVHRYRLPLAPAWYNDNPQCSRRHLAATFQPWASPLTIFGSSHVPWTEETHEGLEFDRSHLVSWAPSSGLSLNSRLKRWLRSTEYLANIHWQWRTLYQGINIVLLRITSPADSTIGIRVGTISASCIMCSCHPPWIQPYSLLSEDSLPGYSGYAVSLYRLSGPGILEIHFLVWGVVTAHMRCPWFNVLALVQNRVCLKVLFWNTAWLQLCWESSIRTTLRNHLVLVLYYKINILSYL